MVKSKIYTLFRNLRNSDIIYNVLLHALKYSYFQSKTIINDFLKYTKYVSIPQTYSQIKTFCFKVTKTKNLLFTKAKESKK